MGAAYGAVVVAGCVQVGEPLTAEDRCVLLCQGNDANHPCHGEEPAEDCVTTCVDHITPLVDDCLTCVLTQSGWIGNACVCQEVDEFGMLDVECDACSYTTHDTKCAASTECTRDTETCEGFELVEPTDPICSPACG
jgi:hypothetical protein